MEHTDSTFTADITILMYNDPVKVLRDEHKLLQNAIDTTRQILELADDEQFFYLLNDLTDFFRTYTEEYHYPKEDKILYPVLRNRAEKMNKDFLQEISNHHHDFNDLLCDVEKFISIKDREKTHSTLENYIDSLSEHMKTENKVILSVAEFLLGEQESRKICNEFMTLDARNAGKENTKNVYHEILNQIV